jgi:hypothetical protein
MSMSLRVQRPGANRGEFEDSSPSESRSEPPEAVGHMAVTVTTQILCVSVWHQRPPSESMSAEDMV